MSRTREDGVRRRAEERARRRAAEEQRSDPLEAAKAAAAAAAAGATAGALRAMAARRGDVEPDGDGAGADEEPELETGTEPEAQSEPEPEPVPPAEAGTLREIAQRARRLLVELRGVDAEAVSGLTRTSEGWVVTLEVVELRRIPESTDVLATYEVEVDEDGRLLRYQRCGRYHRSQADRNGEA